MSYGGGGCWERGILLVVLVYTRYHSVHVMNNGRGGHGRIGVSVKKDLVRRGRIIVLCPHAFTFLPSFLVECAMSVNFRITY